MKDLVLPTSVALASACIVARLLLQQRTVAQPKPKAV